MRNASRAFHTALLNDQRDYVNYVKITLTDGTVLELHNDDIWEGGIEIEDAVSADNVFQVGAAIINQAKVTINNIYDTYSEYDFYQAKVYITVGLTIDGAVEALPMGTFVVDEAEYNGSLITLTCLDYLSKFDKPYDTAMAYSKSTTLGDVVRDAYYNCLGSYAAGQSTFPHSDYYVPKDKPSGENTTYRQVLSWAAQIAGCFVRCRYDGYVEFKWYNTSALDDMLGGLDGGSFNGSSTPYADGDTADGGSFNPWNTGYAYDAGTFQSTNGVHVISSSYSQSLSTDDVVITGVKVVAKQGEESEDAYKEYTASGSTEGYVISVEGNDFIGGADEYIQAVANWLGTALIGVSFRKAEITHPSDPTIEAGDVGVYVDRNGRIYKIIVSSTTFKTGDSQNTASSAATPLKNSAQRYTEATRDYVALRKQVVDDRTAWEAAEEALSDRIDNAGGLYESYGTDPHGGSGQIYRYHNKPSIDDSDVVMLFNNSGFFVTPNYKASTPTWYGLTVDGQAVVNMIQALGASFDWAIVCNLMLGGQNNQNGRLTIKNSVGSVIGYWDSTGIHATTGEFSGTITGSTISGSTITTEYQRSGTANTERITIAQGEIDFETDEAASGYRDAGSIGVSAMTLQVGNVMTDVKCATILIDANYGLDLQVAGNSIIKAYRTYSVEEQAVESYVDLPIINCEQEMCSGDIYATGNIKAHGRTISDSTFYHTGDQSSIFMIAKNNSVQTIFRNDATNFYLLLSNSGAADGLYNTLRPFTVNRSTGKVTMSHGLTLSGGITMDTGNIILGEDTDIGSHNVQVQNSYNHVGMYCTTGNAGLYHDATIGAKWLIYIDTSGTVVVNTSDRRLKNIYGETTEFEARTLLAGIHPVNFSFKNDGHKVEQNGFIAQEFRDLLIESGIGFRPYLVIEKDGEETKEISYDINEPEEDVTYSLDYAKFTPILWKGWQMHEKEIAALKEENNKLRDEVDDLTMRLDALEEKLAALVK